RVLPSTASSPPRLRAYSRASAFSAYDVDFTPASGERSLRTHGTTTTATRALPGGEPGVGWATCSGSAVTRSVGRPPVRPGPPAEAPAVHVPRSPPVPASRRAARSRAARGATAGGG